MGNRVRFGIAPATWDTATRARLETFVDALGYETGLSVEPYASGDYRGVVEALERAEIDLAWLPPVVALRGVARGSLVALLLPVRAGSSTFASVLFARPGSRFRSPSDLDGASVAWVDRQSAAGYLVIRAHLAQVGVDLGQAFAHEEYAGTHPRVAHAVLSGRLDLGATYACANENGTVASAGWSAMARTEDVQVVASAGPIPADVVAMSLRTSIADGRAVQQAMLRAAPTSRLGLAARALFAADGFEVPLSEHLAPLARLLDAFPDTRRFSSSPPGKGRFD
jgi:phosphonate transport system substrate-binding protein